MEENDDMKDDMEETIEFLRQSDECKSCTEFIPGTGYPEIVEQILKNLRTKDLKSCRLVNKLWNSEACRALQKRSFVRFNEDKLKSETFVELEENRTVLQLPSPFKNFRVAIKNFKNETLEKILQAHPNSIIDLHMNRSPSHNNTQFQLKLFTTLTSNWQSLKTLRVAIKSGIDLRWRGSTEDSPAKKPAVTLHLPALEDFGYWESGRGDKTGCVNFLQEIMSCAPHVRKFNASCQDAKVLDKLLPQIDWTGVEAIYAESIRGTHVQHLSAINAPKLKRLELHSNLDSVAERVPSDILCSMVEHFSQSLQQLSMVWFSNSVDLDFPHCPHLTKLQLDGWDGTLGVFDVKRLPNLEKISLFEHHEQEDAIFSPHIGVKRIRLESSTGIGTGSYYTDEEFDFLLLYFRIQYPKLESLEICMPLSNEAVRNVVRHFSATLQTLHLDTKTDLGCSVFTGRNSIALEYFANAGLNLYEIAYVTSLRDMTGLKKLVLGSKDWFVMDEDFQLSNRIIQYGIAEMPALKIFHFKWNSNLAASIVADSLWYLNEIVVLNGQDPEFFNDITYLQLRLPQVIID